VATPERRPAGSALIPEKTMRRRSLVLATLAFGGCPGARGGWWPFGVATTDERTCDDGRNATLTAVAIEDGAGLAASFATTGAALVLSGDDDQQRNAVPLDVVARALSAALRQAAGGELADLDTAALSVSSDNDASSSSSWTEALARVSVSSDVLLKLEVGPLLEVWTNGAWRSAIDDATPGFVITAKTHASDRAEPLAPFVDFVEADDDEHSALFVPKYGVAVDASSAQNEVCRSVAARATRVRMRLNGDGGAPRAGLALSPCAYATFDELVERACDAARDAELRNASVDPPLVAAEFSDCDPRNGARLFDGNGTRLTSIGQLLALENHWATDHPQSSTVAAADVWAVPSGVHWVWPTVRVGHSTTTRVGENPAVFVETLSLSPAVFRLRSFFTEDEALKVVERNKPLIKPSEVGLVGRAGDKTRTSSNAWDTSSPMARTLIGRAFDLLKIDASRKLEDGLQVLHYENEQWYKPHVDYFTSSNGGGNGVGADAFANAVPTRNNGTNRFATVFLYLSDAGRGGETCFPLSTTHAGYAGGRLTHPGTEKTPGFIRNDDAKWVCNESSEALRVAPRIADAVLFYSQRGDGSLDPRSLHGSCPIHEGEKWAANLWVWNRPRDAIDKAKDVAKRQMKATFVNHGHNSVDLFWKQDGAPNELALIGTVHAGGSQDMNTYPGHVFVAKVHSDQGKPEDRPTLGQWEMKRGVETIAISKPPAGVPNRPAPHRARMPDLRTAAASSGGNNNGPSEL